jgi:hypothetical protein
MLNSNILIVFISGVFHHPCEILGNTHDISKNRTMSDRMSWTRIDASTGFIQAGLIHRIHGDEGFN